MTLSEKISHLCERKGVTRNKFEIESGVGRGQSARWDKNKPSGDKLRMAADYFGVSVEYLLSADDLLPPPRHPVVNSTVDSELNEYIDLLRERPEMRTLLHVSKGMTAEQVEQMAKFIMTMRGEGNGLD